MKRVGYGLLGLVAILTVAQLIVYPAHLPERVASHFGPNGQADGWTTRSGLLTMLVVTQVLTAAFLLAAAKYARFLSPSMVNVPNKEYWLHESRREETFDYMEALMTLITAATALFLTFVFHCVFLANVDGSAKLSIWFGVALVVYLVFTMGTVIQMMLRFRIPKQNQQNTNPGI